MNDTLYKYLVLWSVSGIGSITARKVISYAGGIENVFKLKRNDFYKIPGIGESLISSFLSDNNYKRADSVIEFSEKNNIRIISSFRNNFV